MLDAFISVYELAERGDALEWMVGEELVMDDELVGLTVGPLDVTLAAIADGVLDSEERPR